MRFSVQVSLLAFTFALGSAGPALADASGVGSGDGYKGGFFKQPPLSMKPFPSEKAPSWGGMQPVAPTESSRAPAGTAGNDLARAIGQEIRGDERPPRAGAFALPSDEAEAVASEPTGKPHIIAGENEVIAYVPMHPDDQAALAGMASLPLRGTPSAESADKHTASFSQTFGSTSLLAITPAADMTMDSRGNGSLRGNISASLIGNSLDIFSISITGQRADQNTVNVSGNAQILGENVSVPEALSDRRGQNGISRNARSSTRRSSMRGTRSRASPCRASSRSM